MNPRFRQILLHLIGWFFFVSLPLLFFPGPRQFQNFLDDHRAITDIIRYFLLIGFFYLNYVYLVPKLYFQNKYLVFALCVIGCYAVVAWLPDLILPMKPPPDGFRPPMPPRGERWGVFFLLGRHLLLFLLVFVFSFLMRMADRWKQAEKERKNAEVAYLQSQINPHFLFNTLNSIYSLAIEKSDQTPEMIVKLSSMMRYVITEATQEFVTLAHEVEYLKNFISFQRLRFGPQLQVTFAVNGNLEGAKVAPLLFIPIIENAFKYGVSPEEASTILIEVDATENEIHLLVENKKVQVAHVEKTGLGLTNLRRRLDLLYVGKHTLTVNDKEDIFSVSLFLLKS